MKSYALVASAIAAVMLALFALAHALGVETLTRESFDLGAEGLSATLLSLVLLTADTVLPVPSSAVMVANGAVFGAPLGSCLSLAGSMAAALVGFGIGRASRTSPRLSAMLPPDTEDKFAGEGGSLIVFCARPIPILAETTTILAGASNMSISRFAVAAFAGSVPIAIAYGVVGSLAATEGIWFAFLAAFAVAAGVYLLARRVFIGNLPRLLLGPRRHRKGVTDES